MAELTLIVEFEIKANDSADFRVAAQRLIDATNEEPGTLSYDWHISDDHGRDINLERFREPAAFVAHDQHVAPLVPALMEAASLSGFSVLGAATDDVRERLAGIDARFFDHLGGIDRQDGGSLAQLVDIEVKAGQLEQLKAVAARFIGVAAGEPGTLAYDWYISPDGAHVRVVEQYRDGQSCLDHVARFGDLASAFLEAATVSGNKVLGEPGVARDALTSPGTEFYTYFSGIDR